MKILIKNGKIINPADHTDKVSDLLITDGFISEISENIPEDKLNKTDRIIDAGGCFVFPGFIDMHVHLRDPGQTAKEDIGTGTMAAAAGGFTTIVAMPNTTPPADNPDIISYVNEKAAESGRCHVLQAGSITEGMKGEKLSRLEEMISMDHGIKAVSEDGKSVMNTELLREAMQITAKAEIPVLAHCEDINLVAGGVMNKGSVSYASGIKGISNAVENIIEARDIMVAEETHAQLHLCHCSTKESAELIRDAKKKGINVTGEVCPHHFTLTEDDIRSVDGSPLTAENADTNYKMNPPLRSAADRQALLEGLKDGTFEVISTDHAPHTADEKAKDFTHAPFGIVGLETSAALTYTELVLKGWLTPMQMAEKMSANPAGILHIDRGDISVGKPADVTVFDPKKEWTVDPGKFFSKGHNTPFAGMKLTGKVRYTILDGVVTYEDSQNL